VVSGKKRVDAGIKGRANCHDILMKMKEKNRGGCLHFRGRVKKEGKTSGGIGKFLEKI